MSNLLALFDTILNRANDNRVNATIIEDRLYWLARDLDISADVIADALDCDRQLVVYEP